MSDDGPRLPARTAPALDVTQLAFELQADQTRSAPGVQPDWPPFSEPPLVPLKWSRRLVLFARVAAFAWACAAVGAAAFARRDALDGTTSESTFGRIGPLGIVVAVLLCFAGWLWSDRATVNVHHLGGRLPTRARCLTAWVLPLVSAAVLAITVLRMEPTEVVDIRPTIIVVVMVLVMWRPYSLVRRVLASLTRVRSDGALGIGYVFDLTAFGLLWWQMATWPAEAGPADLGQIEAAIGIAAVAAIGLAINLSVWTALVLDVERAAADRVLALRTRYDHRQLRLRGINPMDPEVRWAMLRIRQQDELARQAAIREELAPVVDRRALPPAPASVHAPSAGPEVIEPATTPRPLETSARPEIPEVRALDPVDADATSARAAPAADGLEADEDSPVEVVEGDASDEIVELVVEEEPAHDDEPADVELALDDGRALSDDTGAAAPGGLLAQLVEGGTGDEIISELVGSIAQAEHSADFIAELADEEAAENRKRMLTADLGARFRSALDTGFDRFRLDSSDAGTDDLTTASLLDRLAEFGITPHLGSGDEPVPVGESELPEVENWVPPRLYALEAARLLVLLGFAGITATAAWIVTRSVGIDELLDGNIPVDDVTRLDNSRRAFVTMLGATLTLMTLWCATVASQARKAGMPSSRRTHLFVLAAVSAVLNVIAAAADGGGRGTVSLFCALGCLAVAVVAAFTLIPVITWFKRRLVGLVSWTLGLVLIVLIAWAGGLFRATEAGDSLGSLTFTAALLVTLALVFMVLAALNTSDVEDAVRLAPMPHVHDLHPGDTG